MAIQREPLLVAGQHDLDRPARLAREAGGDGLEPHERLGSKRAAHRRADDADLFLRQAEELGQVHTQVERRLRARPNLQAVTIPARHAGVWLHVRVLRARNVVPLLDDDVGLLEAAVDVAVADAKAMADVGALLRTQAEVGRVVVGDHVALVDKRRALSGRLEGVEHGRPFFIVHRDQSERLLSLARRRGCDRGYRVADVACDVGGEHRLVLDLAAVAAQVTHVVRHERHHPVGYSRGIHTRNARVRVGRAQDARVQHPIDLDVLGVAQRSSHARVCRHHAMSSSARRTSTAITRRRYSAEPRASEIGSIASA